MRTGAGVVDGPDFSRNLALRRSAWRAARRVPFGSAAELSWAPRPRDQTRIIDESRRKSGARLLRPFALEPVLERPLDRPGGDGGSRPLLGLGVGDRDR